MFRLGDFAFDRITVGLAKNFESEILYTLHQLADATIDVTGESKEVKDKDGNLIRKIWITKAGTFSANNAMPNVNILNASSGTELQYGDVKAISDMPSIKIVKASETEVVLDADVVEGTISVAPAYANGASGTAYKIGTAGKDTFAYDESTHKITLPTLDDVADENKPKNFIVAYKRASESGLKVANYADKFPKTIELVLKALYIDPCLKDGVRPAYIVLPSFQPSPETNLSIKTDSQLEYKGDLQLDYCGEEKALYYIYFPDEVEQ